MAMDYSRRVRGRTVSIAIDGGALMIGRSTIIFSVIAIEVAGRNDGQMIVVMGTDAITV